MKSRNLLFGVCCVFFLGLLLGGVLTQFFLGRVGPEEAKGVHSGPTEAVIEENSGSLEGEGRAEAGESIDWSDIASDDLHQYIENLRAMGCPSETVSDIVVGLLASEYTALLDDLETPSDSYWRPVSSRGNGVSAEVQAHRKALMELVGRRKREVYEYVGIDYDGYVRKYRWDHRYRPSELGFISDRDVRERAEKVLRQFKNTEREIGQRYNGLVSRDGMQEIYRSYEEKFSAMKKILSPEEFQSYVMRDSPLANRLKDRTLSGFEPNEEEFESIFSIYERYDGLNSELFETEGGRMGDLVDVGARNEEIRDALGEDRYRDYERSQDHVYRRLVDLGLDHELDDDIAAAVYNLREVHLELLRWVNLDQSLAEAERLAELEALRLGLNEEVRKLMGDSAYGDYSGKSYGNWLNDFVK